MTQIHREIIVLGAGPAGVAAASALLEKNQPVSLISHDGEDMSGRDTIGTGIDNARLGTVSPKILDLIGTRSIAAYLNANGLYADNFSITGHLRDGGLSNAWGAVAPRWSDAELAGFAEAKDQIRQHYEALAPQGSLLSETGVTARWRRAIVKAANNGSDRLDLSPNMVRFDVRQSMHETVLNCRLCGECHKGCRYGAIYDASSHLDSLKRNALLERLSKGVVQRVEVDGEGKAIITCRETSGLLKQYSAARVIVALGTLASTRLLAPLLPPALRPDSVQTTPAFAVPLIDTRLFVQAEKPGFALSQAIFDMVGPDGKSGTFGSVYSSRTIPPSSLFGRSSLGNFIGKSGLTWPLLRQMDIALGFLPGRFSRNRLEFRECKSGEAAPGMVIVGGAVDGLNDLVKHSVTRLRKLLAPAGIVPLSPLGRVLPPGNDTHYGASLRPGMQTTLSGALINHPSIYCVDGAVLPDLPAKHPTLTIMANARRIAHGLLTSGA